MEGKHVAITGIGGFIGSHLAEAVRRAGAARLVGIDNFAYGRRNNLSGILGDREDRLVLRDIREIDTLEWTEILDGIDVLFHLAAEKHNQSRDDPERVLEVNVVATRRLFAAARAADVRKLVFASSLYAHGRRGPPAIREGERPLPDTTYGTSKLAGEHLLAELSDDAMRYTTLRFFVVYGPRQFAGSGYRSVIIRNFERILRGDAPMILAVCRALAE